MNPTTKLKMKWNVILALLTATLLLTSGVVLAKSIDCTGGPCVGTQKPDQLIGTEGDDEIVGRGGKDIIIGDPAEGWGDDLIRGGDGDDSITDNFAGEDVDTIFAGKGDDVINVRERRAGDFGADVIDCGPGKDTVIIDVAVFEASDTISSNCEIVNPS